MLAYIFAWLFVFTIPWQNSVLIPGLGTISKLLGIGAMGATGLHVLLRGKLRKPTLFHWLVFAFLFWVFLSTFWSVAQVDPVKKRIVTYSQILVMIWLIWEMTPTRSRLVGLLQAYVLGAYVAAGSTIFNYATGAVLKTAYGRYAASGFDPNDLGSLLALALPIAWYLASTAPSGFHRWLNRAYFVVGSVAILLTGSRSSLLATIVALCVVPWTLTQVRRGVRVAAVVVMVVAGAAAVRFVPAKSFQRLATTSSEITHGTLNRRLDIWKRGIQAFPERPLHGFGPGGWYKAVRGEVAPHNTYLAILVEEGLIGLFLYLSILAVVLNRLLRLHTFERRVGLTLLATLVVVMTPLGWQENKASWLVLALLTGLAELVGPSRPATPSARPVQPPLRRPRGAATSAAVE